MRLLMLLFAAPLCAQPVLYHGGRVMTEPVNVYFLWYGNWDGNTATTILPEFARALSNSDYFKVNTTYRDAGGNPATAVVNFGGAASDRYSRGRDLDGNDIEPIIAAKVQSGDLPADERGLYVVLLSSDVSMHGFCTIYCAYHNYTPISLKYALIGNPEACPRACIGATKVSPNHNQGADFMASLIAHELSEMVTDPHMDAWYDEQGMENADKCLGEYGWPRRVGPGETDWANITLGDRNYLIQKNWVNDGAGYCAMKIGAKGDPVLPPL
jgi:hypothetical protein